MTAYSRNWTKNRGTNTSLGALRSFRAPPAGSPGGRTRPRVPYKYRRVLVETLRDAARYRMRFQTKLAMKVVEYAFEGGPEGSQLLRDYGLDVRNPWAVTQEAANVPAHYRMNGWVQACTYPVPDKGCGITRIFTQAAALTTPICNTSFQVPNGFFGDPISPNARTLLVGPAERSGNCLTRYHVAEHYYRPANVTNVPEFVPARVLPRVAIPVPAPLRVVTQPMQNPARTFPRRGALRLRPYERMARQFEPAGQGNGRGSVRPAVHALRPPGRKEKESKFKLDAGLAGKLYGGVTEFNDFTEAVAAAVELPNGRDCRNRNPYKAWQCIIANKDKLNRRQAEINIIANQIEDFLIGQVGKANAKAVANAVAAGYYRSPVGFQFGQSYWRNQLGVGPIEEKK